MTKPKTEPDQPVAGADVERAVAQLEALPAQVELDLKTAKGDLRDALLEAFRNRPKQWSGMSQLEQTEMGRAIDMLAERLITKVAHIVATAGHKIVTGTLDGITIKDGMKITIKAPMTHEAIDVLADATGKSVTVMRVMDGVMMGERKPVKVDADQPSLIPDDDSDLLGDADQQDGESQDEAETDQD